MKLTELKRIIDVQVESMYNYEDPTVMVAIKLPYATMGALPMVEIKSAHMGFDWESGKFILHPVESLSQADRDFESQMKELQTKYGWLDYENRGLKSEIKKLKKQMASMETKNA